MKQNAQETISKHKNPYVASVWDQTASLLQQHIWNNPVPNFQN